jgi:AcrR family transcriptional regulator
VRKSSPGRKIARRARTLDERQAKERAILDAALAIFVEQGFASARLDDVAERAGVAKGTLYLYFESKQALFEALVRTGIAAPVDAMRERILASDAPIETVLRLLFGFFSKEVLGTERRDIVRLILTEAPRFPAIAELYHREVVMKGIALLRHVLARSRERGGPASVELESFPHLVIAPALVALVWKSVFEPFAPLDADALFGAHLQLLLRAMETSQP